MNLIEEAKKIWNGKACPGDIDLLANILDRLGDTPCVVMLGAGEIFTLTTFGVRPKALLYTIDNNQEAHWWEQAAKENCGINLVNHVQILGNSPEIAKNYRGPKIDLLIIDADHSLEGVLADLQAWGKHLNKQHIVFCHDYDAKEAPYYYPGVKKACGKYFERKPDIVDGWSAVFVEGVKNVGEKVETPLKKKPGRKAKK